MQDLLDFSLWDGLSASGRPLGSHAGVLMKQTLFFVLVFASGLVAASDMLTLSEGDHDTERKVVAVLYAEEIAKAKSFPGSDSGSEPTIAIATIDLNRDGKSEIVARLDHTYFCGSHGCRVVILSRLPTGNWKEIAAVISQGELEVHDEYKNNYRTITFDHASKKWVFQNGRYQLQSRQP